MLSSVSLLFLALLAGGINAVAGGGSFLSFPGLIVVGLPALQANATNATALWPAAIASSGAYWKEITQQRRGFLTLMISTSVLGSIVGALLLLHTPATLFQHLLPALLLLATLVFALGQPMRTQVHKRLARKPRGWSPPSLLIAGVQFVIAIYGGYFGAGIGMLMLTTLGLMGMNDIHVMNGLKTLLVACISGIAVLIFIVAGDVFWPDALTMMIGSVIGGYIGAASARKLDPRVVRGFIVLIGIIMTVSSLFK